MVILFVAITFAIFVGIDALMERRQRNTLAHEGEALHSRLRESEPEFVAGYEMPEDARLLMRLLDASDSDALLCPLLAALLEIVESGKRPNRMLLIQKIDALKLRLETGDAVELADTLRAALD